MANSDEEDSTHFGSIAKWHAQAKRAEKGKFWPKRAEEVVPMPAIAPAYTYAATVERIIDGDT